MRIKLDLDIYSDNIKEYGIKLVLIPSISVFYHHRKSACLGLEWLIFDLQLWFVFDTHYWDNPIEED